MTLVPGARRREATELEVRFAAEGDGTRVDLEHRGWEILAERAQESRERATTSGWGDVLGYYTRHLERLMGYSVVNVEEIEGAGPGGAVRFVRRELGLEAFGINWFELPPGAPGHEHDEADSGQEEVNVVVAGSGRLARRRRGGAGARSAPSSASTRRRPASRSPARTG